MCFSSPSAPNPSKVEGQTLQAQVQYAPEVYNSNAQFSPLYTGLSLQNLSSFLNGTDASTTTAPIYDKNGRKVTGYSTTSTPANEGFLSMYANSLLPTLTGAANRANTMTRTANITDAQNMTPSLIALARGGNPGGADLLDKLTSSTSNELSYGTELTPGERTQMQQSVRGGQAARGLGFGPSDVFNESLADTNMGQSLLQNRESNAAGLVPLLSSFYGNPLAEIGGMGGANADPNALLGQAAGGIAPSQSGAFNPESAMAMQFGQQKFDQSVATANNRNTWITAPTSYMESS